MVCFTSLLVGKNEEKRNRKGKSDYAQQCNKKVGSKDQTKYILMVAS